MAFLEKKKWFSSVPCFSIDRTVIFRSNMNINVTKNKTKTRRRIPKAKKKNYPRTSLAHNVSAIGNRRIDRNKHKINRLNQIVCQRFNGSNITQLRNENKKISQQCHAFRELIKFTQPKKPSITQILEHMANAVYSEKN